MTITSISTLSQQQSLTSYLQAEQTTMTQLTEELATGQKYNDLTDYAPSDALNMMNLQATATQKQAYLGVITTVQARLSGYDTTMTDMESIVAQAQTLADGNQTYSAGTAASIAAEAGNYLKSVTVDLNQQIGGRYIYAGSRYTTQPVSDLSTLTETPSSTIYTDNKTLPIYDTGYSASALTMAISGQTVTIGGTVGSPQNASVTVSGTTYTYAVQPTDTTTKIASALATEIAVNISGTSSTNGVITVGATGTITAAGANVTNTAAYATDSATIDAGDSVQYGVTSNNPAFQQLIAGLRYIQAAGNSTNSATYSTDMAQASSLLSTALTNLQSVHTTVADNINTLTQETTTQNTTISNLANQLSGIQSVDITQVSTELTALQVLLQASYSATGTIERMSIVNYL